MYFKQVSKDDIQIMSDEHKEIGRIFTPSGSAKKDSCSIQVCGFDYAFDLWGCANYATRIKNMLKDDIHAKKDIQLMFCKPSIKTKNPRISGFNIMDAINNCSKCYSMPCKCSELKIYSKPEIVAEFI